MRTQKNAFEFGNRTGRLSGHGSPTARNHIDMNNTINHSTQTLLRTTGQREHPYCFACGNSPECGLGLHFELEDDGAVVAEWNCPAGVESYPGILHGGIVATLLDSAMVHVLFSRGITAHTGDLRIRFRKSVITNRPIRIRAWLQDIHGPLFRLEAELWQGDARCARAQAGFMKVSQSEQL